MNITIFHYHLKPGGVTQVITQSIKAMLLHLPAVSSITLVAGSRENVEAELQKLKEELPQHQSAITFDHVPEINYLEDAPHTRVADLEHILTTRYKGSLWWVHNYHLGKNPVFTEALVRIADNIPEQKIVFHIHDFPESGRYENMDRLYSMMDSPLYPVTSNVRYAVINGRDRDNLVEAGMDPRQLSLLHNPCEGTALDRDDRKQARTTLGKALEESAYEFHPGAPIMLYPVRTIRRKNVLEGGLLSRCLGQPVNLVVTLPGVSSQERPYSQLVSSCFVQHLIPGAWGIGDPEAGYDLPFSTVVTATDLIFSSSVMEGFGYLFINALSWGKPLFARNLPTLRSIEEVFRSFSSYFYRGIEVPLTSSQRKELRQAYLGYLEEVRSSLPEQILRQLKTEIETVTEKNAIDFSFLSVDLQHRILQQAQEQRFQDRIREDNPVIFRRLHSLLEVEETPRHEIVQAHFSLERFAATAEEILDSFTDPDIGEEPGVSATEKQRSIEIEIQKRFATLETMRLLFRG